MSEITMCGYRCDLCKAYAPNIEKDDRRYELASAWKKYYNVDIPIEDIWCDGCRCQKENARLIDTDCPVRKCVIENKFGHCGECENHPCSTFTQREGLTEKEAEEKGKSQFNAAEYNEYLLAYDNRSRIHEYKKNSNK
jgi:hypothetical protein